MTIYSLDALLSQFGASPFSMSSSNRGFLTCIQISQEAGSMVWYSHLLKSFPQFVMIHIVKSFSIVNESEVDVFLELSCFLYDSTYTIRSLVVLPFYVQFVYLEFLSSYCWSITWMMFSITLLACEMSAIVGKFEHSLALSFFGIEMKIDLFMTLYRRQWSKSSPRKRNARS